MSRTELRASDIQWAPVAPDLPRYDDLDIEAVLIEALIDAQSYRALAQQSVHALRALTVEHDRLRQQRDRLIDEHRRLRAQIREAAA